MKRTLLLISALAAIAIGAYGTLIEPFRLRVRRVQIPVSSWDAADDPVRILHITDLHLRAGDVRRVRMLHGLSHLRPDLLLLTGDLIHGGHRPRDELETVLAALAPIRAAHGAYAVLGNHDHVRRHRIRSWLGQPLRFQDTSALEDTLKTHGIRVLTNTHATVTIRGKQLTLIGVDDPFYWLDDIGRATAGAPRDGARLLLAHTPDIIRTLDDERFDLILCGHTHGGQVRLSEDIVWHTNTRMKLPRNAGLMRMGDHLVYCSAGVGVSVLPVRINCPPEVGWIELVPAQSAQAQPGATG